MTFEEIKQSDKEFLTSADISPILKSNAYTITLTAQREPHMLGFPVSVMGKRVRIPRRAFIRFCEGRTSDDES